MHYALREKVMHGIARFLQTLKNITTRVPIIVGNIYKGNLLKFHCTEVIKLLHSESQAQLKKQWRDYLVIAVYWDNLLHASTEE